MHMEAVQVQKGAETTKNLWKLRGAHSDQAICWNEPPLNFREILVGRRVNDNDE